MIMMVVQTHADSKIANYQKYVKNECSKGRISNLLLKKSLIELVRGFECDGKFTALILKKCQQIDCRRITEIYRQVQQARPGAVVGDE